MPQHIDGRGNSRLRASGYQLATAFFCLTLSLLACSPLSTGIGGGSALLSTLLFGKSAGDIIEQAEQSGRTLLGQAEASGSAVAVRLGNELTLAAAEASTLLGEQLDRAAGTLRGENAKIVNELALLNYSVRDFVPSAYALKDSAAVDLQRILGDVRFLSRRREYLVQRIEGITQIEQPLGADYRLSLVGLGLGTNTDREQSRVEEVVAGGTAIAFRANKVSANQVDISIPNSELAALFREHALATVPVSIQVALKNRLSPQGRWKESSHSTTFYLALLPKKGARVIVTYTVPKQGWVEESSRKEFTYRSPDHHQSKKPIRSFVYTDEAKALPGQRFAGPKDFRQEGEGCPWTKTLEHSISPDNSIMRLKVEVWGTPCLWTYWAKLEREEVVGEEVLTLEMALDYGKNSSIALPPNVTSWKIEGRTATLHEIDVVGPTSSENLRYVTAQDSSIAKRVTYRLEPPR